MTTVPLGHGAYQRLAAGSPEIRVENRWLEANPTNLREHAMLLSRPGTTPVARFPLSAGWGLSPMRGNFSKAGMFNGALFVVSGTNLYRYDTNGTRTLITGIVSQGGFVVMTWQKGIGFERLFIADGLLLQFYAGTTAAHGTLVGAGTTQTIKIDATYYTFAAAITGGNGTLATPYQVINTGGNTLNNLLRAINATGTPGVTYSTLLTGPHPTVTATSDGNTPIVTLTLTAKTVGTGGNAIATVETAGVGLTFSGATLANGGIDALQGVTVPDGLGITTLASVSGYVLAGVANSQKFFWINPGAITIDALDFAEKESNPDNIVDMNTVGDQVLINGNGSTENWYATGNANAPFAPVEGRVYARGAIAGTPVPVQDGVILVGNDGVVYQVGQSGGGSTNYGVTRISDHGIEERIRRQLRREQGLSP